MGNDIRRITVIGSGNVAEALALNIAGAWGVELVEVVARNAERGEAIAMAAGCDFVEMGDEVAQADLYIIAVSDRAVAEVAEAMELSEEAIVVHTAGSVELSALGRGRRGVFYPFQTFTAGRAIDLSDVPIFIEGSDEATTAALEAFAEQLSSKVYRADSHRRREIHLSGVWACNFVNALYGVAADVLHEREGLSFEVLQPLILETAHKAAEAVHPAAVQTGPARRGDSEVMARHEAMLTDKPELQEIYRLISEEIYKKR
jgi:predicted short-subunit dehydrogenase-like oxidoreductase (DUF2520 family)